MRKFRNIYTKIYHTLITILSVGYVFLQPTQTLRLLHPILKLIFLGANSRFPLQVLVQNHRGRNGGQGAPVVALVHRRPLAFCPPGFPLQSRARAAFGMYGMSRVLAGVGYSDRMPLA
ncbi:MAG: hypothetical protein JJU02_06300 [Cryomorphaceae bacterium]|nr:hypothetical protein [Cryomorphaceae bacterium]